MDLYELAEVDVSTEKAGEVLAEQAHGMALDNGSDMLGVNPEEHAVEEWDGYLEHALEMYADICHQQNGSSPSDERLDELRDAAVTYWTQ